MYIVIKQEPFKVTTFETKSDLASYLNVHRNTITNRFELNEWWESEKGVVYQSSFHYKRDRRGNNDDMQTKIAKREGLIDLKHPKKR